MYPTFVLTYFYCNLNLVEGHPPTEEEDGTGGRIIIVTLHYAHDTVDRLGRGPSDKHLTCNLWILKSTKTNK